MNPFPSLIKYLQSQFFKYWCLHCVYPYRYRSSFSCFCWHYVRFLGMLLPPTVNQWNSMKSSAWRWILVSCVLRQVRVWEQTKQGAAHRMLTSTTCGLKLHMVPLSYTVSLIYYYPWQNSSIENGWVIYLYRFSYLIWCEMKTFS